MAAHLTQAIEAALQGKTDQAAQHARAADLGIWHLGEQNDAELLRDFIAGLAHSAEDDYLHRLGTPIHY